MAIVVRLRRMIGVASFGFVIALISAPVALAAEAGAGADPAQLTFAALVTPPGMVTASGLITTFIQILKGVFPGLDAKVSGALQAFFLSMLLYIATGAVLFSNGTFTSADAILWIVGAWLGVATGAIGIKAGFTHAVNAPAKGLPLTDAVPPPPDPGEPLTDPAIGEDTPRFPA